jgi:hypothetical protein
VSKQSLMTVTIPARLEKVAREAVEYGDPLDSAASQDVLLRNDSQHRPARTDPTEIPLTSLQGESQPR